MKTVEDFTQFEQLAAYFDGDPLTAMAKGMNILDRSTQVHFMAEVQNFLDFPPAPGLGIDGKLNPKKFAADSPEMKGQKLFFGKAQCCRPATRPRTTPTTPCTTCRWNASTSRRTINGMMATAQGPIKTFTLRGIKESPPYLHDGRLLTLEDTVEFFNIILETQLTAEEKEDLVAFMRQL